MTSRRNMLKTGLASMTLGYSSRQSLAAWKAPGETRVICHAGDFSHNPISFEQAWRRVLGPADWRVMFAQTIDFITPEVLEKTDLFVMCRYDSSYDYVFNSDKKVLSLGFSTDPFVEDRPSPAPSMTEELETAIIDNVRRGMGLLSIHCSIWNGNWKGYMDLLGVQEPIMHTIVQPTLIHELNPDHPITRGIAPFHIGDDEIFNAKLKPGESELLFKMAGDEEKVNAMGGWCREEGKGRIVSLLPGHTTSAYIHPHYNDIMWRSAHWAMKKNIPDYPLSAWFDHVSGR